MNWQVVARIKYDLLSGTFAYQSETVHPATGAGAGFRRPAPHCSNHSASTGQVGGWAKPDRCGTPPTPHLLGWWKVCRQVKFLALPQTPVQSEASSGPCFSTLSKVTGGLFAKNHGRNWVKTYSVSIIPVVTIAIDPVVTFWWSVSVGIIILDTVSIGRQLINLILEKYRQG